MSGGIRVAPYTEHVEKVYELAREEIPDPIKVDVSYWDDGTVTIRAIHNDLNRRYLVSWESDPERDNGVFLRVIANPKSPDMTVEEEEKLGELSPEDADDPFKPPAGPIEKLRSLF